MTMANGRFGFYAIVGAAFGVLNWFFLNQAGSWIDGVVGWSSLHTANPLLGELTQWSGFAIWMVPAVSIILVETLISRRPALSALGVSLLWLAATVTYFLVYVGKLLLGLGGPQLGVRLDKGWATYWNGVAQLRLYQMVGRDFVLWFTVALLGGPIVGWVGGLTLLQATRWWRKRRKVVIGTTV